MKKVQYSLIVQGENPTLEDAARKSIMFSNQYQMLMSRYISENSTFKTVKVQLENFDQYKKDWAKKERESEFDKIIDVFKSYTINRIHDINKHNIIKDNLEGGYTVADYFEKQNPKRKIEYQKLKTKNPNVFRIVIEVSENDTPFSLNIFEYDFVSKQFTHIETIQQQDLINAD
ncbi:hypothetical protein [Flavobacterium sp. BFFFF1]|uniref:hypothetical protein n=1 Tax=Flavobacterium sp. BFFFF1 TaxID=2015557 RepID=UPI0025BCFD85|nr:hypothetical protein [Flavobacterium sp. BFFFF1]